MIHGKNRRAHMDQRAHMQHQTDIPGVQARGKSIEGHVSGHSGKLEVVGPSGLSVDHHGRPSGL